MKKLYLLITKLILSNIDDTGQYLEYEIKFGYRNNDLSPRKCFHCLSEDHREVVTDKIDYYEIGKDVVCNECGKTIGSWYAGSWDV